jgi:hypothetical protein
MIKFAKPIARDPLDVISINLELGLSSDETLIEALIPRLHLSPTSTFKE